ncbi:MAG: hypothetical protein IT361_07640 [Gemmatimonadaceae bacterium]|nr:hypothetical protein [Gemmatimonadaceae bacterium]
MTPHVRVPQVNVESATPAQRAAAADHERVATMTNLKRTMLQSVPAFRALMTWYDLRDTVRPFLGERLTTIFAHAISASTDCLICSTFFRRLLIEAGDDPDALVLDDRERAVVAYGRRLSASPFFVPEATFGPVRALFSDEELVALTAFGALMVATNVMVNALDVPLDGYLEPYRRRAS